MQTPVRVAMIGCGGMARYHLRRMLTMQESTRIAALCEPSPVQYAAAASMFEKAGLEAPPNILDLNELLEQIDLDAVFIVTPHAYHFAQARTFLQAGLDVLLEKPMVMNAEEAKALIEVRDRSGKTLVVAFPGSLSPQIRHAVGLLRGGSLGKLLSISGVAWQNWGPGTADTWRQQPVLAGGGFLFDTGAHLLNTVVDLAGEEFVEVAAWLDQTRRPVETMGVVMGRLASGAMVTLHGCGEAPPSCASQVHVFCSNGMIRTGIWGERLLLQGPGDADFREVPVPASQGVWEQFLAVRQGTMENPCPPEVGLRMSKLYDAICRSAAQDGRVVAC